MLPSSLGKILFYCFGPTLALAALSEGRLLRFQVGQRPFHELGVLCAVIAGIAVNMMAVIQDSNGVTMTERVT